MTFKVLKVDECCLEFATTRFFDSHKYEILRPNREEYSVRDRVSGRLILVPTSNVVYAEPDPAYVAGQSLPNGRPRR